MITKNTHIWILPSLYKWRALLVQMHAFKKLGNLQRGLSISTPAFHSLIKTTMFTFKGNLRACKTPSYPFRLQLQVSPAC